jgi:hypothetical protein
MLIVKSLRDLLCHHTSTHVTFSYKEIPKIKYSTLVLAQLTILERQYKKTCFQSPYKLCKL